MKSFSYFAPKSVSEAISLLRQYGDSAKVLAGGLSIISLMRLDLMEPEYIIDLKKIKELNYIRESADGRVSIGALSRHTEISESEVLNEKCALISEAAGVIGHPQIRNKGTIGGSLSHADPAADYPACILALEAVMRTAGPNGERSVRASEFFKGAFRTDLQQNEILTEISVPTLDKSTGSAYMKLCLSPGDFPVLGVAVILTLDANGICTDARVALGGATSVPLKVERVEKMLAGQRITDSIAKDAGAIASQSFVATDDIRTSGKYKTMMAKVFTERTIKKALQRAQDTTSHSVRRTKT